MMINSRDRNSPEIKEAFARRAQVKEDLKWSADLGATFSMKTLGVNILRARHRRNETQEAMAMRAGITRQTLARIEKGDPDVLIGSYAKVLWAMGMVNQLVDVAHPRTDTFATMAELAQSSERIRRRPSDEYNF